MDTDTVRIFVWLVLLAVLFAIAVACGYYMGLKKAAITLILVTLLTFIVGVAVFGSHFLLMVFVAIPVAFAFGAGCGIGSYYSGKD
jgi:hypothetical protein